MTRVAILSHIAVSTGLSGKEKELTNIATLIAGKDITVEIFSLSWRSREIIKKDYIEHEISSPNYSNRSAISKVLDNLFMVFFKTKPMLNAMNENPKMLHALEQFDPDIIICGSFLLSKMLAKYLSKEGRKVKVISIFDSQKVIYNYARTIERAAGPIHFIAKKVAMSYIRFNLKLYADMLRMADVHVVPTEKDRGEVEAHFKDKKADVIALPAQFFVGKMTNAKPSKRIKSILFIGSYGHSPNKEAMENIERIIAPMMPEKKFVIGGGGCPKKVVSNVHYIGTIPNVKRTISQADLCIAPLTSGSGLKVKMLDYFGAGKAVIGTSLAFDGYKVRSGHNAIVEDDISRYPLTIRDLESDKRKFALIQRNSNELTEGFKFKTLSRKWNALIHTLQSHK